MDLNDDQQRALLRFSNSRRNLFITGPAGTGKSRVLRKIVELLKSNGTRYAVLAPTSVAAKLIDGETWHRYFGVGIMQGGLAESRLRALSCEQRKEKFRSLEVLILDEVSFVCEQEIRLMSWILQTARDRRGEPFGGVRVVVLGDFAQLPPVPRWNGIQPNYSFQEANGLAFNTWGDANFETISLRKNMRTEDRDFAKLLESIRVGRPLTDDQIEILEGRKVSGQQTSPPTALRVYPTRAAVEQYNTKRLSELPGTPKDYIGQFIEGHVEDRHLPLPRCITLKVGARVMVRMNMYQLPSGEVLNGDLGEVVALNDSTITVKLDENNRIEAVPRCKFDILDANYKLTASFFQFPITLAYAVTVHKAQGQTIEQPLVINLSGTWLPGQAYVALSRVTRRDLLYIEGSLDHKSLIQTDERVSLFYEGKYQPRARRSSMPYKTTNTVKLRKKV